MRGQLLREFGDHFDVSGTGNYLVVHPAGQRDRWADDSRRLFRSFVHYFSVRGMRPAAPEFPLVAVVLPSQRDFVEYVQTDGRNRAPARGRWILLAAIESRAALRCHARSGPGRRTGSERVDHHP